MSPSTNHRGRTRRTRLVAAAAPAVAIAVSLQTSGCGGEEAEPEVLRPVRTVQVFTSSGTRVRTFPGTARAGSESRLSFRVGGTVEAVEVDVGDAVARGQLLARIDPEDHRLQVREAEAALAQAEAQARSAQSAYERVRALYEANNASAADYEAARAAGESAEATVRAVRQRVRLAQQQLAYTRLTAPADGAVAAVNVEAGENVSAGQAVVLLTAGSGIEVEVALPELLIARVREGDRTTVSFDALPDRSFDGVVTEVGVAAVGAATTYPVTVALGEAEADIRSGMAAEVAFTFEPAGSADRLVVPSVAVGEDAAGRFVYVVEPAEAGVGVVSRRTVATGDLTPEGIEVLDGLGDGDHVVVAGVSRIQDGMRVRFGPPEGPSGPAPSGEAGGGTPGEPETAPAAPSGG